MGRVVDSAGGVDLTSVAIRAITKKEISGVSSAVSTSRWIVATSVSSSHTRSARSLRSLKMSLLVFAPVRMPAFMTRA